MSSREEDPGMMSDFRHRSRCVCQGLKGLWCTDLSQAAVLTARPKTFSLHLLTACNSAQMQFDDTASRCGTSHLVNWR